jgi:hypothetical protein
MGWDVFPDINLNRRVSIFKVEVSEDAGASPASNVEATDIPKTLVNFFQNTVSYPGGYNLCSHHWE